MTVVATGKFGCNGFDRFDLTGGCKQCCCGAVVAGGEGVLVVVGAGCVGWWVVVVVWVKCGVEP